MPPSAKNSLSSQRFQKLLGWILLAGLMGLSPSHAPRAAWSAPAQQPAADRQQGAATQPASSVETLHLLSGRSLVITSPVRIKRVSVADPAVLDAVAVNPNQLLLNGKAPGVASLVIWDETGQSQTFDAYVDLDVAGLKSQIRQVLPNEPVAVDAQGSVVTLSGRVSSQAVADRVTLIAQATVPKKEDVVSLLEVPVAPGTGEVLLAVKFADVNRSTLSELGVNLFSTSSKLPFTTTTGQFGPPSTQSSTVTGNGTTTSGTPAVGSSGVPITLTDLLNIFIFRPDINLGATIQALEQKNLLQILAEPNVLAETGKEASFVDGGQFPYPVVQGSTGGVPVVTIQFREFGVKLAFTPVITPDGLIHLKVAPEVSSLDFTNALTLQGFTIPSLTTRRVETEMILNDGQSFVIAGLVNNQVTEAFNKIPGLGDLPILGHFFKSRSINKSDDELLVMVTPRIVHMNAPPPQPAPPHFPDSFLPPLPREKPSPGGAK
jgi:pilus assembly protein CpaC